MCLRGSMALMAALLSVVAIPYAVAEQKTAPALKKSASLSPIPSATPIVPTPAASNPQPEKFEAENRLRMPRFINGLFDAKPKRNGDSLDLPLGINYSREAKGLMLSLDDDKAWGIGVGLDLSNRPGAPDTPVNGVIIDYRPAPGAVLQRRF